MPVNPTTAYDIKISETLDLLDGPFAAMAEGVSNNLYTYWLGSGISRGKVPDLKLLIKKVLIYLQEHLEHPNDQCKFKKCLKAILSLASASNDELNVWKFDVPVDEWPNIGSLIDRLLNKYADMLDIDVEGEAVDYLLWDAMGVANVYADPHIGPDVEHICMALLAAEGVASDIATANWDDLLEKAVTELGSAGKNSLKTQHPYRD